MAATQPVSISDGEESGTNNKVLDDSSPALVSSRNDGLALLSKLLLVVSTTKAPIDCKWPASSDSIGSYSFYSRKLSRRPSSWPPTASSSSFPCPTCWRLREGVTTAGANGWTRQIQGRPPRPSCPATTTTTAKRKRGQSRTFGSRQLKK